MGDQKEWVKKKDMRVHTYSLVYPLNAHNGWLWEWVQVGTRN